MPKSPKKISEASPERQTYSWLMLIESRHSKPPEKEPERTTERGRPRLNVATYPTSVTFSKGDREALTFWQDTLSRILGRKVSLGEAAGFAARVCQERLEVVQKGEQVESSLQDLVYDLIHGVGKE